MAKACGAKSKHTGQPCKAPAMANGRCRVHGGSSTGPINPDIPISNQRSKIHGIYSKFETEEEQRLGDELIALDLWDELRNTRLQRIRALAAQKKANDKLEVDEVIESAQGVTKRHKRTDYQAIIDRLTARIQSLIRDIHTITGTMPDGDDIFLDPDPDL